MYSAQVILLLGFVACYGVFGQSNDYDEYNYGDTEAPEVPAAPDVPKIPVVRITPLNPEDPICECSDILLLDKNSGEKYSEQICFLFFLLSGRQEYWELSLLPGWEVLVLRVY